MTDRRQDRAGNGGFVLIAVLGVLALLSGMVVVMLGLSRNSVDTVLLSSAELESDALLQSGTTLAAYELFVLGLPPAQVSGQQTRFNQGVVTLTVRTDAGKVDLNVSGRDLLAAAYRASGLTSLTPESFAANVIDWRDQDDKDAAGEAETAAYAAAGLDYSPRNRGFRIVDDLRWVLGVSGADLEALRGLVTIHNPRGRLDAFSAAPALILALSKVAPGTVEQVVTLRANRNPASTEKIDDLLLVQASLIDTAPPVTFRVLIDVRPNGGATRRQAEIVISAGATPDAPFHILQWSEGT